MKPGFFYNGEYRNAFLWLCLSALALGGVLFPFASGMDLMKWGYGLSVLFGLGFLFCFLLAVVYFARGKLLAKMLRGHRLLAHWMYTPEEWSEFTETERREEHGEKMGLFLIIAFFAIIFGVGFAVLDPENGMVVLGIMTALILLIGFVAWLVPELNYRRNKTCVGEVFIAENGVFISGAVHFWDVLGAKLCGTGIRKHKQKLLEIAYTMPTNTGNQEAIVRIPIPKGREKDAFFVVRRLRELIN